MRCASEGSVLIHFPPAVLSFFVTCYPSDRLLSVEKIARSFLGEFTNTLNRGQDGKWTSELSKVHTVLHAMEPVYLAWPTSPSRVVSTCFFCSVI